MKTTVSVRKEQFGKDGDLNRDWYCVDASDKTLGRISTEIAKIIIRNKNRRQYLVGERNFI